MPTQAGSGFFKSLHLVPPTLAAIEKNEIPSLEIRKIKETPYLFATTEQAGVATRSLLASSLKDLILSIDFPKKMRWSDCDIEYARPLKWIVALYGQEVISFAVGNVVSSHFSYGHRQLAPQSIEIRTPKEYLEVLRKHWVLVDVKERRQSIEDQIEKIEQSVKGKVVAKERVMPQVLHLVEYPFLTIGHFDPKFLQAPKEVSISEMVEHQKYFPLAHLDGELMADFVIACNNKPTDLIRQGHQRALSPRLSDGMFLYEEDLKVPLDQFNEKLKMVTFQKELGSVWEKVQRVVAMAEMLHTNLPICDLGVLKRAATLCKADLASHLVGEFPELQGVAGKLYALKQKEPKEVADAIEEHWMPRGEKAPLPQTNCGLLLSLAEKLDNLISCFSLDLKPTSSSDPYALRRQALGFLKMLIEGRHHLSLNPILKSAFAIFLKTPQLSLTLAKEIEAKKESLTNEIMIFFANRFRTILLDDHFEKDEIEAALSQGLYDPYDLYLKLEALRNFRGKHSKEFSSLLEIYTRTKKILFSQNPELVPLWMVRRLDKASQTHRRYAAVNPALFKTVDESTVYQKMTSIKHAFHTELIDRRESKGHLWHKAFLLLVELQHPLANLFDHVKIIDDAPEIRNNRLALLQEIWDLCEELADFSKIQEHAPSPA